MISLIHLSDIHYRADVPAEQGCVIKAFIEDLKIQIRDFSSSDKYLMISGDLVFSGISSNYTALKKDVIDNIKKECGIPYEQMIFIPGNHDIDRDYIKKKYIELQSFLSPCNEVDFNNYVNEGDFQNSTLGKKFIPFKDFYSQITNDYRIDAYTRDIRRNVTVLCINSALCSFGGYNKINDIGNTRILNINTRKVEEWIGLEENKDKLKIILMHHPIECLSNNASIELKRTLKNHNNILVLTGHTHEQDIENDQIGTTSIIYSYAPQLFCEDRNETLGYSIVMIDDINKDIPYIKYREWSNKRKKFVTGEDFAENGIPYN